MYGVCRGRMLVRIGNIIIVTQLSDRTVTPGQPSRRPSRRRCGSLRYWWRWRGRREVARREGREETRQAADDGGEEGGGGRLHRRDVLEGGGGQGEDAARCGRETRYREGGTRRERAQDLEGARGDDVGRGEVRGDRRGGDAQDALNDGIAAGEGVAENLHDVAGR